MSIPTTVEVRMKNEDRWAAIVLSLGGPFSGGKLVELSDGFALHITGADDLAAGYGINNWVSAIISGALFAYRASNSQRRKVYLSKLEGRLGSGDMSALARGASVCVSQLLGETVSQGEMPRWEYTLLRRVN